MVNQNVLILFILKHKKQLSILLIKSNEMMLDDTKVYVIHFLSCKQGTDING